jgi:LacI family transcriptional regulator
MAVSAVLNGAGGRKVTVTPEKAERIRQAARDLRYQTNHAARNFRSGKTGQIAVVFQNFGRFLAQSTYRGDVMNGVMAALFPANYTLALCPKLIREGNPDVISDGRFDGVLWCRPDLTEDSAIALQGAAVPVVLMHAPPGTVLGVPTFCADNDGAMRRVVSHLISLGHEEIAFVIDPITEHSVEGQARAQALRSAAARAGLPEPDVIVLGENRDILCRYAEPNPPHTAFVCFSDELAGFVLTWCKERAVEVPRHVSVVGFDSSPICEATTPRLTSVNQPVERMAFEATSHLLALIRSADQGESTIAATSTLYDCRLDIRESTGPICSQ